MGPVDSLLCPHFRLLAPVRFLQAEAVDPEVRALLEFMGTTLPNHSSPKWTQF